MNHLVGKKISACEVNIFTAGALFCRKVVHLLHEARYLDFMSRFIVHWHTPCTGDHFCMNPLNYKHEQEST